MGKNLLLSFIALLLFNILHTQTVSHSSLELNEILESGADVDLNTELVRLFRHEILVGNSNEELVSELKSLKDNYPNIYFQYLDLKSAYFLQELETYKETNKKVSSLQELKKRCFEYDRIKNNVINLSLEKIPLISNTLIRSKEENFLDSLYTNFFHDKCRTILNP